MGRDRIYHICNKQNLFSYYEHSPSVDLLTALLLLDLTLASLGHSEQLSPCPGLVQVLSSSPATAQRANDVERLRH